MLLLGNPIPRGQGLLSDDGSVLFVQRGREGELWLGRLSTEEAPALYRLLGDYLLSFQDDSETNQSFCSMFKFVH